MDVSALAVLTIVAPLLVVCLVLKVVGFLLLPPTHLVNRILNPLHVPGSRQRNAGGDGGSWGDGSDSGCDGGGD